MGAIGGLLGLGGGAAGTSFSGPQGTNIVNPTNSQQIAASTAGVGNSMQSQQNLLNALQAQNGLGNQSSVYNQQQGLSNQLTQANGVGNESAAAAGFQNIANGTGPNVAQSTLNQNTGTNVANQAALMAGQRGASANVGLMARQAAQQGAATQQAAVGQAATLQAQQQQAALSNLASTGASQVGQLQTQQTNQANLANTQASNAIGQTNANTAAQQQEQANLFNAQAGVNNANVTMQGNINNANAGLANTQMQGQQGLIGGVMQGLGVFGGSGGAGGGEVQNYDDGGDVEVTPASSASPSFGTDAGASAFSSKGGSGGGGGSSSIMSMLPMLAAAMANGGDPSDYSLGADTTLPAAPTAPMAGAGGFTDPTQPQSKFGQFLKKGKSAQAAPASSASPSFGSGPDALRKGAASMTGAAKNALSSPSGQNVTMPDGSVAGPSNNYGATPLSMPDMGSDINAAPSAPSLGADLSFARGGTPPDSGLRVLQSDYRSGGPVKAKGSNQKATRAGNSYTNDKIPAVLSEHEIVIPRSITMGKDPVRGSAQFVAQVLAKRKVKR